MTDTHQLLKGSRRTHIRRRWIIGAVAVALAFVVVSVFMLYRLTRSGLPDETGTIRLAGLSAPVRVIRDHFGIPHIYAQNRTDLARALGYVEAQDRLFQIEMRWRLGEGRLAEIFGPEAAASDYLFRLFDAEKIAARSLSGYTPSERAEIDAFVGGINAYVDQTSADPPFSFRLLGIKPQHIRAEDLEAAVLPLGAMLGMNPAEESLYMNLAPRFDPTTIGKLFPVYPGLPLEPPSAAITAVFGGSRHSFRLTPGLGSFGHGGLAASNNWVVDGSMTASGKPMLANDPHLPQTLPSIWYEAVLVTPEGFTAGATTGGAPAIAIGTNGHVAWGVTSVMADVTDFSLERLSEDGQSYEYKSQWYPLEQREVTIHVKGGPDVRRVIRSTRHGPIVSEVLEAPLNPLGGVTVRAKYALALRFAGGTAAPSTASFLRAAEARSGKELVEAYRQFAFTPLNLVWADEEGNIGWHVVGAIPNRVGFDGKYPTPGFSGEYEWQGMIPYDELPHVENPPAHFIVTANNRTTDVPYNGGWVAPWRHDRIANLLDERRGLTVADFKRMQADRVSLFALKVKDLLIEAGDGGDPDLKWALAELKGFDGAMARGSRAAAIAAATEVTLWRRLFGRRLGKDYSSLLTVADHDQYSAMEDALSRPESTLWTQAEPGADRTKILRESLAGALALLTKRLGSDRQRWKWGKLARIRFVNLLGRRGGVLGWYLNRGPMPLGAGRGTVDRGMFRFRAPFDIAAISSYRLIVDMAHPEEAIGMNHTGESGHPASPHYDDMIAAWMAHRYHRLDPRLTTAQAEAEAELDLTPDDTSR